MTNSFQPPRDRDAYAAIRGYVYQIDRTLERWVELRSDQVLELERGEDIDLIGRAMASGHAEQESRLLEQVKRRDANITLRSEEAIEALVNFYDHREANPLVNLRFCFLTNATVGREQLNPFPARTPGINLWEQLRLGQVKGNPEATALSLVAFLTTVSRPDGISQTLWTKWIEYLGRVDAATFIEFVRRFHWSTAQPGAVEYRDVICEMIRARGYSQTDDEARELYGRLFVHVIRLLATPGLKQLTPEDLPKIAATILADTDRSLLNRLEGAMVRHAIRLDLVEDRIGELGDQFTQLMLDRTQGATLEVLPPVPDLTIPPPVERLSPRYATVERLNHQLNSHTWLAIHGGPNSGKSQLAIQLASRGNCRTWIRFSQFDKSTFAVNAFDTGISRSSGLAVIPGTPGWYTDAAARLGPDGLVILDDLPRLLEDDPFAQRLVSFCRACIAHGVRLLSTSQHVLPGRFGRELGSVLIELPIPPFTEGEAEDLFRVSGAPPRHFAGQVIAFFNRLASGHPLLLVATIDYLRQNGWNYSEHELTALLQGEHTNSLMPEIIGRLTHSLGDSQRELLYRLTLPIYSFTNKEVFALAAVEPEVARPQEVLNPILGSWVQRVGSDQMIVSPLVKSLGKTELSQSTRKTCFVALSHLILHQGSMDLTRAEYAILYSVLGDQLDRAGVVYMMMLAGTLLRPKKIYIADVIGRMWKQTKLPSGMSLEIRLLVRTYQLAAFTRHGIDVTYVVRDIRHLLRDSTDREGLAIIALAVQATIHYSRHSAGRVINYISRALALPEITGPDGKRPFPREKYLTNLLWMVVGHLRKPKWLRLWIDAVDAMPDEYRDRFWRSDFAQDGMLIVGNSLYLAEFRKPIVDRKWDSVIVALREARTHAEKINRPRIEAALTLKILQIVSDLKRLEQLATEAEPMLARWPADPDVQFLIRGSWGRQCTYNARHDLARPLLAEALAHTSADIPQERIRTLLAASHSFGEVDAASGVRYAQQACDIAMSPDDRVNALLRAQALGELAVATYLVKQGQVGAIEAFTPWSNAIKALLDLDRRDKFWRDTMSLCGHYTAFLAQFAKNGRVLNATPGEEQMAPPIRSNLLTFSEDRAAFYKPHIEASLPWLMSVYAEAAGNETARSYWVATAATVARNSSASFMLAFASHDQIPELLRAGLLEDAIEKAVFAGRGMQVINRLRTSRPADLEGTDVDLAEEFGRLSKEERRQGDRNTIILGVLPAFLRIIPISFDNPAGAAAEGRRIAAMCRQLSGEAAGYPEMWHEAASLIEMASVENMNPDRLIRCANDLDRDSMGDLQVLAYLLATWHDSLAGAFYCQLATIQNLHRIYPPNTATYRHQLLPYFEAFWRRAILERRVGFDQLPTVAADAIEKAFLAPEPIRVRSIVRAASIGFRIQGFADSVRWLREVLE